MQILQTPDLHLSATKDSYIIHRDLLRLAIHVRCKSKLKDGGRFDVHLLNESLDPALAAVKKNVGRFSRHAFRLRN